MHALGRREFLRRQPGRWCTDPRGISFAESGTRGDRCQGAGGPEDLDFVLPGVMPVEWQRFYNSRDERRNGLFGAGWSVPYEVSVHIELHPNGSERLIYIDEQARRIDMGSIALGGAVFSAGEGRGVGSPVSEIQKPKLMLNRLSTDTAELQPVKTDIRCQIDVLHDRLPQRSLGV